VGGWCCRTTFEWAHHDLRVRFCVLANFSRWLTQTSSLTRLSHWVAFFQSTRIAVYDRSKAYIRPTTLNDHYLVWGTSSLEHYLVWCSDEEWQRHGSVTAAWTQLLSHIRQTVTEASALINDAFTNELTLPPLVVPWRPAVYQHHTNRQSVSATGNITT